MGDELEFSDAMHFRASLMMHEIPIPEDLVPKNEKDGMLRHRSSVEVDEKIASLTEGVKCPAKPEGVQRTPSVAFGEGEQKMIAQVLAEVDRTATKRMKEGFQEINFAAGVLNSFLMAYVFGAFPQHFWLLYLVEGCYFLPAKFMYMIRAKPLNQAFYYFDLCWFLNFFAIFNLFAFVLSSQFDLGVDEGFRKGVYLASIGAACGPLLCATIVLPFVAFLFHDVNTMTGLFIHLYPPMIMYTLIWHADALREAWPAIFHLDYISDISFFPESGYLFLPFTNLGSVASNSIALYFSWFIFYSVWQVSIGMDLPRKFRRTKLNDGSPAPTKYDTVFHSTVRGGLCVVMGKIVWGRPKSVSLKQMEDNDFELRDLALYMGAHALASVLSIYVSAYACFSSKAVHLSLISFLLVITVHRGAKRYTYYSTMMYGRMIRKQFAEQMSLSAKSKKTN